MAFADRNHDHRYGKHALESAWENAANQRFHYDNKTGVIRGYDGRVLDVEGNSNAVGAKLIFGPDKGQNNQRWDHRDGYLITRMGTGFVIDTWGVPDFVKDGAELRLGGPNNGNHQKWDIDRWGFVHSRHNSRFVMDVFGFPRGHEGKCDPIVLYPAKMSDADCDTAHKYFAAGTQRFHYDHKTGAIHGWDGRCLDVEGNSKDIGAKLGYGPYKNQTNQQWDHRDGYLVTRMGTGFVVDTWGGPDFVKPGAELRLGGPNNGNHQKWDIDAYGFIRSRHKNNCCITIPETGKAFEITTLHHSKV